MMDKVFFFVFCSHQVFWAPYLTGPFQLERLVWGGDPIPMPAAIGFSLRRGRGGSLSCMWIVQTHRGPPLFKSWSAVVKCCTLNNIISPHIYITPISMSWKVNDLFYKLQMLWSTCCHYHHNLSTEIYIIRQSVFSSDSPYTHWHPCLDGEYRHYNTSKTCWYCSLLLLRSKMSKISK